MPRGGKATFPADLNRNKCCRRPYLWQRCVGWTCPPRWPPGPLPGLIRIWKTKRSKHERRRLGQDKHWMLSSTLISIRLKTWAGHFVLTNNSLLQLQVTWIHMNKLMPASNSKERSRQNDNALGVMWFWQHKWYSSQSGLKRKSFRPTSQWLPSRRRSCSCPRERPSSPLMLEMAKNY